MKVVRAHGAVAVLKAYDHFDNRGGLTVTIDPAGPDVPLTGWVPFKQVVTIRALTGSARGFHVNKLCVQGKLVHGLTGKHYSVAVDCRPNSPTKGSSYGCWLSALDKEMLWVPPGFAHGTMCIEAGLLQYFSTTAYDEDHEVSLALNSPDAKVEWPAYPRLDLVSPRDLVIQTIAELGMIDA